MTQPRSRTYTFMHRGRVLRTQVCTVFPSFDTVTHSPKGDHYLVLGHCTDNEGTDHSRQSSHSIWDAHENAGIAGGDVQMVDIKTYSEANTSKSESRTEFQTQFGKSSTSPSPQFSSINVVSSSIWLMVTSTKRAGLKIIRLCLHRAEKCAVID